ncbi:MAG: S8 family serine peptidase [Sedimentisphaerales bacterium]
MKKARLMVEMLLLCLLFGGLADSSFSQINPLDRRVLIGFKDGIGGLAATKRGSWVHNLGGDVHHSFRFLPLVSARLPEKMVAKLKSRAEIAYIEDDIIMHAIGQETPWGVDRIDAELVWPANTGAGVDVAILDTGIDYDHPDLVNNIAGGVNFVGWWWVDGSTNKYYWNDRNGHGSHNAGIVAAANNNIGIVGVAPAANLWAVRVLGDNGSGYISDIIQGLEWCVDNSIEVASMSFGGDYSESLKKACDAAYAAGVLLVAAAGNEYGGAVIYPAAYNSVIAVSAIDDANNIADFSSAGQEIELSAPGVNINSTYKNGGYALGSGTSMACPHVAGVAALVWAGPELGLTTATEVRNRLRVTAEDLGTLGKDNYFGYGLVDAAAAAGRADIHNVAVSSISAPSSVIIGQTHPIDVTVENRGSFDETFNVVLIDDTDGATLGTQSVSLAASGSTIVTFSWDTTGATAGDHSLTATAGPVAEETDTTDNSKSTSVIVESAITDIAITAVDAPSPVVQGDILDIYVTVENLGNQNVTSDITVTLASNLDGNIGTQTINGGLAAGALTTLTFVWDTSGASAGSHTLTASNDFSDDADTNNSNNTIVTVQAAINDVAITAISAPSSVVQGSSASVDVTVQNSGNQDVSSFSVILNDETESIPIGTKTISSGLTAGNSILVSFSWDTTNATADIDHTLTAVHNVADDDDSNDSRSIVVRVEGKPAIPTLHVGDITFEADVWSWGRWATLVRVKVSVPILDSSLAAVDRAAVYGSWSGVYNRYVSGSTNSQGTVAFTTGWVFGGGTFTFTVNDVTKAGWTYDSAANVETSDSIIAP